MNTVNTAPVITAAPAFAAFIGLDRSDARLDLCLQVADAGKLEHSTLDNTPEQITPWLEALRTRFGGQPVALCLEQPAGGLLHHFLSYDFVVLYAINPMSLARHRETLVTSRAKSDKSDAFYLMDLVRHYHAQLTCYAPDDAPTRELAALVEARRQAVDLRTQLTNRLKAHLKSYYPQALHLVGDELYTTLACDFLLRWPSLQEVTRSETGSCGYPTPVLHGSQQPAPHGPCPTLGTDPQQCAAAPGRLLAGCCAGCRGAHHAPPGWPVEAVGRFYC
jgi:hypothetical protein